MRPFYFVFVCIIGGALALPSKRGACVVSCSPGNGQFEGLGLADCPVGHSCKFTGCGALCRPDHPTADNPERRQRSSPRRRGVCAIQCSPRVGLYDDLSLPDCPPRHYCSPTGCGAICRPYIF